MPGFDLSEGCHKLCVLYKKKKALFHLKLFPAPQIHVQGIEGEIHVCVNSF